jgi:2-succinyl-6-hydroxy-2,4-cyclohexadiene-1-carboxylate synthase
VTAETEHIEVAVADGTRFHIARSGSGPAVILLHGFTGSTHTWDALRPALSDRYTAVAIDITGHGDSDAPTDPARYSLTRFADDLRDILDKLGIVRASILGYSMGGRATLRFALQHPARVSALILESASPGISDPTERADRVASDQALATAIERDGITAFVDRWERLRLWNSHTSLSDETRNSLRAQRLTNRPRGLANSLRGAGAGAEPAVTEQLSTIRTIVRIIAGAIDAKYVAIGRVMEAAMPHASLELVANAGHMPHLEQTGPFAELVTSFLDEVVAHDGAWS